MKDLLKKLMNKMKEKKRMADDPDAISDADYDKFKKVMEAENIEAGKRDKIYDEEYKEEDAKKKAMKKLKKKYTGK